MKENLESSTNNSSSPGCDAVRSSSSNSIEQRYSVTKKELLNMINRAQVIALRGGDNFKYPDEILNEELKKLNCIVPNEQKLGFGDYCLIEQNRYGAENEHYLHKVITRSESNVWVDVPVVGAATEVMHDHMEEVVWCICCGVCENEVLKYRISDVRKNTKYKTQ